MFVDFGICQLFVFYYYQMISQKHSMPSGSFYLVLTEFYFNQEISIIKVVFDSKS